jgi:short-subunit dehydrogenase
MSSPDLSGTTALVTGASSGIGAAMARLLGSWKCDLVLTARRGDRLDALAGELRATHGVDCRVLVEDLGDRDAPARLHRRIGETGRPIDILINNAGFACYQELVRTSWARHAELLQVNVLSLIQLTHLFLPELLARSRQVHILNVSSIGAWMAVPYMASYGASKACVLSFSEALAIELARTNVRVTCLIPGGTSTEFPAVAGQSLGRLAQSGMMSPERCAAIGLRGMLRGRRVVVPGASNKLIRVASWLLPRRMMSAIAVGLIGAPPAAAEPAPDITRLRPPAGGAGSR